MQRLGHKNYHYVITSDQQTTEDPGPTMKVITNKNNVLFVCVCVCIWQNKFIGSQYYKSNTVHKILDAFVPLFIVLVHNIIT